MYTHIHVCRTIYTYKSFLKYEQYSYSEGKLWTCNLAMLAYIFSAGPSLNCKDVTRSVLDMSINEGPSIS